MHPRYSVHVFEQVSLSSGRTGGAVRPAHRYAELHAHSAYSFLDGANEPEDLAAAAAELGLEALALTDHDGLPGIVKHAEAGRARGLPTVHGAELTLADGSHLPVLARSPLGYRRLSAAISHHNLDAGRRTVPAHRLPELAAALRPAGEPDAAPACLVLTGTANGPLRRALGDPHRPDAWDLTAASRVLGEMKDLLVTAGSPTLAVEIALDGGPADAALTQALTSLARAHRLPLLATGAVRCARPGDARLADVLTATRLVTDLDGARGHLPAVGRWLRGAEDMALLHRRAPWAVDAAAEVAADLAFDLSLVVPDLPSPDVPEGHTPASWLRELTRRGALDRYGTPEQDPEAWEVLSHELDVIEALDFPGYFLIVRSIVDFCESAGILCQGRGSAANSAVCYALGITAVDAVRHKMLFERFLSPGRSGYPDIDLDIEACRREEVIQDVYARYGRDYAAQVANVVSYRPRSAVRDAARALGHPVGLQDRWASGIDHGWSRGRKRGTPGKWADEPAPPERAVDAQDAGPAGAGESDSAPGTVTGPVTGSAAGPGTADPDAIPQQVLEVADRLLLLPRHLGIHSGGMVLCAQPVTEVCPVRWAAMEGRTVLQWDKDDCAAAGLVKFDLLGLGMLTALRLAFTTLAERGETVPDLEVRRLPDGTRVPGDDGLLRPAQVGRPWGLHTLPEDDPAVYRLLTAADTVGVFQVESRAQMATLPRLRPEVFYDIVVEVALIRPGPIQGDAVNPYIRRRLGREKVTYLHDSLRPALEKTLGVPLFQEQLMQIAINAAGFSPAEADALRQAMGSKRSVERMEALHARLVEGMTARGVDGPTAEAVFDKLRAFADFGFPESHAFSFAYLVYASAWLKARKPEDFYAGVLAAQPMGFWSPQTLVADARRHGVRVLPADVNASREEASVERRPGTGPGGGGCSSQDGPAPDGSAAGDQAPDDPAWAPLRPAPDALTGLDVHPELAVRLGLARVKGLGDDVAAAIVAERDAHGPYADVADLARRVRLSRARLETLAACGALASLGAERREALWAAGVLAGEYGQRHLMSSPSSREKSGVQRPVRTGRRGCGGARPVLAAPVQAVRRAESGQVVQPAGPPEPAQAVQPAEPVQAWYQPPLPGTAVGAHAPALREMTAHERQVADLRLTGVSAEAYPTVFLREGLTAADVIPVSEVARREDGQRVRVAGVVTHRQRPHTAAGTVFLNIEDETGLLNVVCSAGMWRRYRNVGRRAPAVIVRGTVESGDGVTALLAEHLEVLPGVVSAGSRDWA